MGGEGREFFPHKTFLCANEREKKYFFSGTFVVFCPLLLKKIKEARKSEKFKYAFS